jgi:phosphoserine phosphatase
VPRLYTAVLHTPHLDAAQSTAVRAALPGTPERCDGFYRVRGPDAPDAEALVELRARVGFDVNVLPADFDPARVRLLITDMDSTLINIECIDEIADFAGLKPKVSAITEAAMRGELNFEQSLTQRVSLLAGLNPEVLQRVYDERLKPNPGAEAMIAWLKSRGIKIALVSGGFTFFTERLKQRLGLDFSRANVLDVAGGALTGRVVGSIVGAAAKEQFLLDVCAQMNITAEHAVAMGDGANDLKMLNRAGLGIAYRAKPKVQEQADVVINYGTLEHVRHLLTP